MLVRRMVYAAPTGENFVLQSSCVRVGWHEPAALRFIVDGDCIDWECPGAMSNTLMYALMEWRGTDIRLSSNCSGD